MKKGQGKRMLLGLVAIFALFQWVASATGSVRVSDFRLRCRIERTQVTNEYKIANDAIEERDWAATKHAKDGFVKSTLLEGDVGMN